MGDGRREAQMLKVQRSRDSLPEAIHFRKFPYMLPMGVDRWIRNNIVCSIFLQTWYKTRQGLPCSLSSSEVMSECDYQREEAVQHVEDRGYVSGDELGVYTAFSARASSIISCSYDFEVDVL
jgi:hypothetical protein